MEKSNYNIWGTSVATLVMVLTSIVAYTFGVWIFVLSCIFLTLASIVTILQIKYEKIRNRARFTEYDED